MEWKFLTVGTIFKSYSFAENSSLRFTEKKIWLRQENDLVAEEAIK